MIVVVLHVTSQHGCCVLLVDDQEAVDPHSPAGRLVLLARSDTAKDAEILTLRHESLCCAANCPRRAFRGAAQRWFGPHAGELAISS
jgi:hypothetical protein